MGPLDRSDVLALLMALAVLVLVVVAVPVLFPGLRERGRRPRSFARTDDRPPIDLAERLHPYAVSDLPAIGEPQPVTAGAPVVDLTAAEPAASIDLTAAEPEPALAAPRKSATSRGGGKRAAAKPPPRRTTSAAKKTSSSTESKTAKLRRSEP